VAGEDEGKERWSPRLMSGMSWSCGPPAWRRRKGTGHRVQNGTSGYASTRVLRSKEAPTQHGTRLMERGMPAPAPGL